MGTTREWIIHTKCKNDWVRLKNEYGQQIHMASQLLPTHTQTYMKNQRNTPCSILDPVYIWMHTH